MTAQLVLEYLKVLLSTPPIAGLIVTTALVLFRAEIRSFLQRVGSVEFPGGKLHADTQVRKQLEGHDKGVLPKPDVKVPVQDVAPGVQLPPEVMARLRQFIEAEKLNAMLWEFKYLNFYLARSTQTVLDWLAGLDTATSIALLNNAWSTRIPSTQERVAIFEALQQHHLISVTGELVEVTPKARDYLKFRGPQAPLPPSPDGTDRVSGK